MAEARTTRSRASATSAGTAAALTVGARVLVAGKKGEIKFVGQTKFADGEWIGVELDTAEGKNDGSVIGVQYFECRPEHGLFVKPAQVKLEGKAPAATRTSARTSLLRPPSARSLSTAAAEAAAAAAAATPVDADDARSMFGGSSVGDDDTMSVTSNSTAPESKSTARAGAEVSKLFTSTTGSFSKSSAAAPPSPTGSVSSVSSRRSITAAGRDTSDAAPTAARSSRASMRASGIGLPPTSTSRTRPTTSTRESSAAAAKTAATTSATDTAAAVTTTAAATSAAAAAESDKSSTATARAQVRALEKALRDSEDRAKGLESDAAGKAQALQDLTLQLQSVQILLCETEDALAVAKDETAATVTAAAESDMPAAITPAKASSSSSGVAQLTQTTPATPMRAVPPEILVELAELRMKVSVHAAFVHAACTLCLKVADIST
jgi:dynactin 1